MRPGKSVLGVLAGLLLGLGVVVLTGPGLSLAGAGYVPNSTGTGPSSTPEQVVTITNTSGAYVYTVVLSSTNTATSGQAAGQGGKSTPAPVERAAAYAQVSNLVKQPAIQTGYAILPVALALVIGGVLYKASRRQIDTDNT